MAVLTAAVMTYLMYWRYTADLTSWMTVRPEKPITSFKVNLSKLRLI